MYITDLIQVKKHRRILISGVTNTGKTTSLPSFIYGPYNPYDEEEREDALAYADTKSMAILTCPGEQGVHSLPDFDITPHIQSYAYYSDAVSSYQWSLVAVKEFTALTDQLLNSSLDVLAIDGLHSLWDHIHNINTEGAYLDGLSLEGIEIGGKAANKYTIAGLYSQTHNGFGQFLAKLYNSKVPLIICTTWEDWQAGNVETEAGKAQDISARRYLWPSIPGKMALQVVGKFDARISARLEKRCVHKECEDSRNGELHHVWQIMSKNDVMGVGVKGMRRIPNVIKEKPWIHQRWCILQELMEKYK